MDESNKSDEAAGDEKATSDTKPNPIDKLVSAEPDHEFTGAEICEIIAALINIVRRRQPELWKHFTKDFQDQFSQIEALPRLAVARYQMQCHGPAAKTQLGQ